MKSFEEMARRAADEQGVTAHIIGREDDGRFYVVAFDGDERHVFVLRGNVLHPVEQEQPK